MTPSRVALLGAIVVVLLLLFPIEIRVAGNHEGTTCGNTLAMDLDRWVDSADGPYRERAFQSCTAKRIDRIGQAVGVTALTVLAVTLLITRDRRRSGAERPES